MLIVVRNSPRNPTFFRVTLITIFLCFVIYSLYVANFFATDFSKFRYPLDINLYIYNEPGNSNLPLPLHFTPPPAKLLLGDSSSCSRLSSFSDHTTANSSSPLNVLILVKSAPSDVEFRDRIRRSWGRSIHRKTTELDSLIFFVLGLDLENNETKSSNYPSSVIKSEQTRHNDLLVFDFIDSYYNNTFKLVAELNYAVQYCASWADYVLLLDDDFNLHIPNLASLLVNVSSNHRQHLPFIGGSLNLKSMPNRTPWSKWYISYSDYPFSLYPIYPHGGTVILDMEAVHMLVFAAHFTQYFPFDDVYIGFMAYKLGMVLKSVDGICILNNPCAFNHSRTISSHGFRDLALLNRDWNLYRF